jgi:WD40 repeat protein
MLCMRASPTLALFSERFGVIFKNTACRCARQAVLVPQAMRIPARMFPERASWLSFGEQPLFTLPRCSPCVFLHERRISAMNTPLPSLTLALPRQFAGTLSALAWSPDSTCLAAVSSGGSLALWDTRTGTCLFTRQVARERLTALAWTGQGRCMLLGSARGTLAILHLASGEIATSATFAHPITKIAVSPNEHIGRFFVVAGPLLRIFTAGQTHPTTRRYATPLIDAAWCPAGRSLAVLTRHGLVEVWDVAARFARMQMILHNGPRCLAWGRTDQALTVGTAQGTIQQYSLTRGCWEGEHAVSRSPLATLLSGELGVIVQSAQEAVLWTEQEPHALASHVHTIALDPRGATLATACAEAIRVAVLA